MIFLHQRFFSDLSLRVHAGSRQFKVENQMVQDNFSEIWREAHGYPIPGAVAATLTWVCLHLFVLCPGLVAEISNAIDVVVVAADGISDPLMNGDALLMVQLDVDSAGRSRSAKAEAVAIGLEVIPKDG